LAKKGDHVPQQLSVERLDQALNALEYANSLRIARGEDKKKMKRGELEPSSVLRDLPVHWNSAKLLEFLLAIPRIGRTRAHTYCKLHGVSTTRRLDELTTRQRELVARTLDTDRRRRAAEQMKATS
jgi:hypothetical protein